MGFAAKDSKADSTGQVNEITKAELIEISIVPIPMNQDSTFSLLSKRHGLTKNKAEKLWLQRAIERATLNRKGAWVAAAVHQQVYNLQESGELKDKEAAMKYISELGKVTPKELTSILAGDVTPVPKAVLDALSSVLRIDKNLLMTLDKGDQTVLEKIDAASRKEGKSMPRKKSNDDPSLLKEEDVKPEPPKEEEKADAPKKMVGVEMLLVPKESCESLDEAKKLVEAAGYSIDNGDEGDDVNYMFPQPGEWDMEAEGSLMDLGDGVMARLMPVKSSAKSTEPTPEEQKSAAVVEPKAEEAGEMEKLVEEYKKEVEAAVSGGEGNPPSWVTDEALWSKAKEVSQSALGEVSYPFVVWWYLKNGGDKKAMCKEEESKKGMGSPDGADASDDNPYLNLAKQQVVMLAQVVGELQKLGTMLQGLPKVAVDAVADEGKGATVNGSGEPEDKKSMDLIRRFQTDINARLKSLGC